MVQKAEEIVRKPVPEVDDEWRPFFDGARQSKLLIKRCKACGVHLAPQHNLCSECLSEALEWTPASGKGTLFTFVLMHQRYHPAFASEIPYNVAVVELEEGPRLNTNIVGTKNSELWVGMPVTVTFEKLSDEVSLPKFRPVR